VYSSLPVLGGTVCCSVLQCVAVGCSGLQWVAVGCSGLQWVAENCSKLQWVAVLIEDGSTCLCNIRSTTCVSLSLSSVL